VASGAGLRAAYTQGYYGDVANVNDYRSSIAIPSHPQFTGGDVTIKGPYGDAVVELNRDGKKVRLVVPSGSPAEVLDPESGAWVKKVESEPQGSVGTFTVRAFSQSDSFGINYRITPERSLYFLGGYGPMTVTATSPDVELRHSLIRDITNLFDSPPKQVPPSTLNSSQSLGDR
jgi:hypothetical protein